MLLEFLQEILLDKKKNKKKKICLQAHVSGLTMALVNELNDLPGTTIVFVSGRLHNVETQPDVRNLVIRQLSGPKALTLKILTLLTIYSHFDLLNLKSSHD